MSAKKSPKMSAKSEKDFEEYRVTCRMTGKILRSMMGDLIAWGISKQKVMKKHYEMLRKLQPLAERLPDEWHEVSIVTLTAGELFIYPYRLNRYINQNKTRLKTEEIVLIRFFQDNPWFYTIFSVEKELYDDFYQIFNYSDGTKIILYSPEIRKLFDRGARLFSALLFFNGDCYQPFGNIHYYKGFQPFDFDYFFKMLIPQYFMANDLSRTIAFRPLHFQLLDVWSEIPAVVHGKELVTQCCHITKYSSFDIEKYSEKFNIEEKRDVTRLRLKRSKFPFNISDLYLDRKKKRLLIFTTGLRRYKRLVKLIREEIELPDDPYYYATIGMVTAVREMLGKDFPVVEFDSLFQGKQPSETEKKELEKLNAFMADLMNRINTGTDYSLEELAKLYDLPMETAIDIERIAGKLGKRFEIDIEGGLKDFVPPPPAIREEFRYPLPENRLFKVNTSVDTSQAGIDKMSSEELYDRLERISHDYWQSEARTILLYTFYMLCKKGRDFEKVRDYAAELLRTFWQVIIPDKKKKTIDDFIEKYTRYILDIFYVFGLVEIIGIDNLKKNSKAPGEHLPKKSAISIKASAFFKNWIRLSDYFRD